MIENLVFTLFVLFNHYFLAKTQSCLSPLHSLELIPSKSSNDTYHWVQITGIPEDIFDESFTVEFWFKSMGPPFPQQTYPIISNKNWQRGFLPGWAIALLSPTHPACPHCIILNIGDGFARADLLTPPIHTRPQPQCHVAPLSGLC